MPEPDDLDELVFAALERREAEGPAALEAFLAEHPEHADALRRRLAALERSGLLAGGGTPERLGEFRLVEELGAGGMGVVHRAVQEPLGREVALKLIRPEQLYFAGARERFEREVAIVARLRHPGIVPVHTFGVQDGLPFFAMERVEGCTLARALQALEGRDPAALTGADLADAVARAGGVERDDAELAPLFRADWVDTCCAVVRAVAEAVEHAHRHGVLHRDLKPSNVMLSPDGRVMLLDFGLAADEDGGELTRTGAQIGSLPYLPPERLDGRPFTRASDVYGLGVTLYELLTLRLPFEGGSAPELMAAIDAGRAPAPRRLNPRVSWDAETVCNVAMEPDLERRYPSAEALARDLTNVLERRPIEARRTGALRRARRWVQRHPGWAAALVLLVLATTVGPVLFGLQQARAAERLERESRLAVASLGRSLEAIREMLVVLGAEDIRDVPHLERRRRELLERALVLYEDVEASLASVGGALADALRTQQLEARVTLGEIQAQLGRPGDAEAAYREALALGAALPERDAAARRRLAAAHAGLAGRLSARGEHAAAEAELRAGLDALGPAPEGYDADGGDVAAHAGARFDLRLALAEEAWRAGEGDAAIERLRALLADEGDRVPPIDRAAARVSLGSFLYWEQRLEEAEPVLRAAIAEAEAAIETTSELVRARTNLADAHGDLAAVLLASLPMRAEEALEHFARAVELRRDLARAFPASVEHRAALGTALMNRGNATIYLPGRLDEGYEATAEALPILRELAERYPDDLEHRSAYGHCLALLGGMSVDLGHRARAEGDEELARERYERGLERLAPALERLEAALAARPDNQEMLGLLKSALSARSAGLIALGRHADAAEVVRRAVRAPRPDWRRMRGNAGRFLMCAQVAGDEATRAAYVDEAMETLSRAVELGYRDLDDLLGNPLLEPLREREDFAALRARVEAP